MGVPHKVLFLVGSVVVGQRTETAKRTRSLFAAADVVGAVSAEVAVSGAPAAVSPITPKTCVVGGAAHDALAVTFGVSAYASRALTVLAVSLKARGATTGTGAAATGGSGTGGSGTAGSGAALHCVAVGLLPNAA